MDTPGLINFTSLLSGKAEYSTIILFNMQQIISICKIKDYKTLVALI